MIKKISDVLSGLSFEIVWVEKSFDFTDFVSGLQAANIVHYSSPHGWQFACGELSATSVPDAPKEYWGGGLYKNAPSLQPIWKGENGDTSDSKSPILVVRDAFKAKGRGALRAKETIPFSDTQLKNLASLLPPIPEGKREWLRTVVDSKGADLGVRVAQDAKYEDGCIGKPATATTSSGETVHFRVLDGSFPGGSPWDLRDWNGGGALSAPTLDQRLADAEACLPYKWTRPVYNVQTVRAKEQAAAHKAANKAAKAAERALHNVVAAPAAHAQVVLSDADEKLIADLGAPSVKKTDLQDKLKYLAPGGPPAPGAVQVFPKGWLKGEPRLAVSNISLYCIYIFVS